MYDLRQKEVININDGCRLGFVSDLELDEDSGKIKSIIIPGNGKIFSVFKKQKEYCISWGKVKQIGDDIILIDVDLEEDESEKKQTHK